MKRIFIYRFVFVSLILSSLAYGDVGKGRSPVRTLSTIINCSPVTAKSGWNILSIPSAASNMRVSAIFPGATSPAYSYNSGYQIADTFSAGKGYWLRLPADASVNICGTSSGNTIPLNTGWNLMGAYDADILVSSITTTPAGIINSDFYGYDKGYNIAASLAAGKGYWIRTSQSGVINVPAVALSKTGNTETVNDFANSPRIIISDSRQSQGTLYFTDNSSLITNKRDLPPVPPGGVFDVRFGSNRNAETSGDTREILIQGAEYPVHITAEGITAIVKDKATGGKIVNLLLQNGKEAVIDNPAIDKLEVSAAAKPENYGLTQNYPNPFNPSTIIGYQLPAAGRVLIKVYDALGTELRTLVNETKAAGVYEVTFDASKLASGIYFYKISAGSYTAVKKMILTK